MFICFTVKNTYNITRINQNAFNINLEVLEAEFLSDSSRDHCRFHATRCSQIQSETNTLHTQESLNVKVCKNTVSFFLTRTWLQRNSITFFISIPFFGINVSYIGKEWTMQTQQQESYYSTTDANSWERKPINFYIKLHWRQIVLRLNSDTFRMTCIIINIKNFHLVLSFS